MRYLRRLLAAFLRRRPVQTQLELPPDLLINAIGGRENFEAAQSKARLMSIFYNPRNAAAGYK
jgi:hypothetical protein